MYDEIIEAVERHAKPDLVFLTGDMAFGGTELEYRNLEDAFINRLKEVLPTNCPLFTVPGKHDVDRDRGIKPRLWIGDAEEAKKFQAPDEAGARKRTDILLPRFTAYSEFDTRVANWGRDWLRSEAGSVWWSSEIHGTKITIVGINTAWLCQDNQDWGRLSPGRYLLEHAIGEAQTENPELLIVLGHHPLSALAIEHEPSGDGQRIRQRLAQANAIYLHGHLHRNGNDKIGDALRTTLTIQAPSAFQAHDDERWRNGILWGEANLESGYVVLEPLRWNEGDSEYKFDSDAGYNSDRVHGEDKFQLLLPGHVVTVTSEVGKLRVTKPHDLPPGWEIVDNASLVEIRSHPPSTGEMIGFFDGMLPTLRLALAKGVQPRAIAEKLAARFRAVYAGASKAEVVLINAAGGEGKSTAILHAAAILIENQEQAWTCLYRQASAAQLPENLFAQLPLGKGHAWVVVIDDADNVATNILAAVKRLASRTDVHFLLAARDAEWRAKGIAPGIWQPWADFREVSLAGLDEVDARRIVSGWVAWGKEAMGHLQESSEEMAVKALLYHARDFATRHEKGELLGALLMTRQSEDMSAHVRTLVNGLGKEPVIRTFSLLDIYVMVAAMHAENQLYLSRSVLAFALGCEVDELELKALNVLRREAMLDSGDTYVLTRHRRIAEAACAVLREDGYDVDRWYSFLAQAAGKSVRAGRWTANLGDWDFALADHFVKKGERWWSLAVRIAKAIVDSGSPNNSRLTTALSSVLRRTRRAPEAMDLLRTFSEHFQADRNVLFEWAVTAGAIGDHGLAAWLGGLTLADPGKPLDLRTCKISLAGLGVSFREIFATSENRAFSNAQAACGQLGLSLVELDATTRGYFERYVADGRENGVAELTPEQAIDAIRRGVILGADEVEPENDPVFFEKLLGDPGGYKYAMLLRIVR
jgi:hypothetical protein